MNSETTNTEMQQQSNQTPAASPMADLGRALAASLADSYAAFLLTQNYHWNVEGPFFKPLHDLFEEQYQEMFLAIDDVAERLRTLGFYAPGTFDEFTSLSSVPDIASTRDGQTMVENLIRVHDVVARSFHRTAKFASDAGDLATEDLAVARIRAHEKNVWMLRSIVGGSRRTESKPN